MTGVQSDLEWAKGMDGTAWQNESIVVLDEVPPPGLDDAVHQLGFTKVSA
jgi:hypothetical protein